MLQLQYYVHGFIDLPLGLFTSVVVFLPTINQLSFTWWLIPVSKWIIAPAISELTLLRPVITRGIIYLDLLSGGEPPSSDLTVGLEIGEHLAPLKPLKSPLAASDPKPEITGRLAEMVLYCTHKQGRKPIVWG